MPNTLYGRIVFRELASVSLRGNSKNLNFTETNMTTIHLRINKLKLSKNAIFSKYFRSKKTNTFQFLVKRLD